MEAAAVFEAGVASLVPCTPTVANTESTGGPENVPYYKMRLAQSH